MLYSNILCGAEGRFIRPSAILAYRKALAERAVQKADGDEKQTSCEVLL